MFVALQWYPSAKQYVVVGGFEVVSPVQICDLLPLFVASDWCPSAKKYEILPIIVISKWCPSAKGHHC